MKIKGIFKNQHGYLIVRTNKKLIPVHRFIWEQYYNKKIPMGMEVHHIDGDVNNNSINNYELKTKSENLKLRKFN